jgi:hypothetical protein
MCRN